MDLMTNRCPYCGQKLKAGDVLDVMDGDVEDVSVQCPNCGKYMRASINIISFLSVFKEENYLKELSERQRIYKESLESGSSLKDENFYRNMVECLNVEIEISTAKVKHNKNLKEQNK
ncbi:zinc ribbon domain-containing protein [Anaerococcus murdochii]|uniref:Zinc ribbon domain-containing protein n=1 Tax=Anaerococcus murdochii TaxID=411577 RepID=A0ABS7SYP3_9FIRM|nr:zinc ribbon domain-containing protein [Anaerococcus murdochii]MBZ2386659.1 zinc ribbon domain-containing protein [Anaerococcus murdochii]